MNPRIIGLEGMAMAGKVARVELEECSDKKFPSEWRRIVATLDDGSKYITGCMEPEAARRNYMVLVLYARNWGKLISWGEE